MAWQFLDFREDKMRCAVYSTILLVGILHAEEFATFSRIRLFVESLTCYRAFVSLTATASNGMKLFRSRTKERERKINLVTGPILCKPYASIHQKSPAFPPGLPTNSEYTTCQWEKKMRILWWCLPCICVSHSIRNLFVYFTRRETIPRNIEPLIENRKSNYIDSLFWHRQE